MFSADYLLIITLVLYAWILAWIAWSRPRFALRPVRRTSGGSAVEGNFPRALEAVWLGSIAVVLLYPIGALLARSFVLTGGLTARFPGDELVQATGIGLVLAAGILVGWAFRCLGRFTTVEIRLTADHAVVRSGPYRWIRHPMYSANMLLSIGFGFVFLSLPLLIPVAAIVVLSFLRSRVEERLFLGSPGLQREYATYRTETGRFFPVICRRVRRAE